MALLPLPCPIFDSFWFAYFCGVGMTLGLWMFADGFVKRIFKHK